MNRLKSFVRNTCVAVGALMLGGSIIAFANYAFTQGSGTNFGSVVVSAVHYAQIFICDLTTPGQCAAVSAGGALKVDNSAVTQPVSAASLPLPAGAMQNTGGSVTANAGTNLNTSALATAAKQPALGTAGTAAADVLTVQGIASMTPLLATLSAETTKVIGTVNQGTSPWIAAGGGTAGSAASGVMTVQGIASMTKLLVTPDSVALPANQSVNLAQVAGTNTINGGVAGSQSVGGTVATNVAITANPLNFGAQAVSSENTVVTTARQVQLVADLVGKLIVLPYSNPENFVSGATAAMTGTTSTSLIAAPASGLRNYVTQLVCTNSHATVGTFVLVQDGSGGTTFYEAYAAAVGGGFALSFPTPLRQPTTATALFVQDVTTGANVICSGSGYKGA